AALALALLLNSRQKYQGEPMASEFIAGGAAVGSAISAWFRREARWKFQFIAGFWFGWFGGHWLFDYMAWPQETYYFVLAGSLMGAISGILVEEVLRKKHWRTLIT